jgi:hypothetical protein
MINIIVGLLTAVIYTFMVESPGILAPIGWGIFMASYTLFFQYTIALFIVMRAIHKNPKLRSEFLAELKKENED